MKNAYITHNIDAYIHTHIIYIHTVCMHTYTHNIHTHSQVSQDMSNLT